MPDFLLQLFSYSTTGVLKVLETGMILFMVLFLVWSIKLLLEPDDGVIPQNPPEE